MPAADPIAVGLDSNGSTAQVGRAPAAALVPIVHTVVLRHEAQFLKIVAFEH